MAQLYSRVSRSLALPISTMPRFIIPLADKLDSSIGGMVAATFTRNSIATSIDANGVLQTAAVNVPRFQNGRYLAEPAATNLFLQSDTPATQTITVVSGSRYTVQCFGTGNITLSGAGSGTVVQGTPVTFTAASTTLVCVPSSIYKAQVELGFKATSYIPTTTNVVTRVADALYYTVGSIITQGQGSLYCEFWDGNTLGVSRYIATLYNTTNSSRFYMFIRDIAHVQVSLVISSSTVLTLYCGTITDTLNKILLTYKDNEANVYINGTLRASGTSFEVPKDLVNASIGCHSFMSAQLNNEIGNVKYFKEVLTEAEAIKITTV